MLLSKFFTALLDSIVPPRATERVVRSLSKDTLHMILLRGEKSGGLPYHDERVRALVWELKYYANARAAKLGGTILKDVLMSIASESLGKPLLIPVPMHPIRRRERGHNQTEVLCEAALRSLTDANKEWERAFEYRKDVLVRIKQTSAQQTLHKYERSNNLKDSMRVRQEQIVRGRVCIVVDDVSTTGATFKEASRALRAAGARHIECVALAYS